MHMWTLLALEAANRVERVLVGVNFCLPKASGTSDRSLTVMSFLMVAPELTFLLLPQITILDSFVQEELKA